MLFESIAATVVPYKDFSDLSALTLTGNAAAVNTADGDVLRLVPAASSRSGSASIGSVGQGIGYEGIHNSGGVEFDTWYNSANNDPDSNHIGIDTNGSVDHSNNGDTVGVSTSIILLGVGLLSISNFCRKKR